MKILVADDSKIARKSIINKIPKQIDVEVAEAENGEIALFLFKTIKPDIVFMDLTMPVMDGYEAIEQIISIDPSAFIIVVTADVQPKAVEKVLELGAKKHIPKNTSETEIAKIILDYAREKL